MTAIKKKLILLVLFAVFVVSVSVLMFNSQTALAASVSGSGIIGGVVGLNSGSGLITLCHNEGTITYSFNTESGCAAGIAGKNNASAKIQYCSNTGTIQYSGEYQINSNIRPCMAQIVGWQNGGALTSNAYSGIVLSANTTLGQRTYISNGECGRYDS